MNTNHNKVEKEINNARKAIFWFFVIFVGVVSVFSHQIYIVQPQQTHNIQQSFERKMNVLQSKFEEEVERKVNVLQSQIEEEVKKVWKNCELKMGVAENQLENKLNEAQKTLLDLPNSFTWKITGFKHILSQAKKQYQTTVQSDPFYILGYKLKLLICPDGNGDGAGTHISLFIFLMKGANDAILSWPFYKSVTVTLIDQQENLKNRVNVVLFFKANPQNKGFFGRPVTNENAAWDFPKFVSHDKLKERRYIVDDTIFIQVELATP